MIFLRHFLGKAGCRSCNKKNLYYNESVYATTGKIMQQQNNMTSGLRALPSSNEGITVNRNACEDGNLILGFSIVFSTLSLIHWVAADIAQDMGPTTQAWRRQYWAHCSPGNVTMSCRAWLAPNPPLQASVNQSLACLDICDHIYDFSPEFKERLLYNQFLWIPLLSLLVVLCAALKVYQNDVLAWGVSTRNALRLTFFPPHAVEGRVSLLADQDRTEAHEIEMVSRR